MTFAAIMKVFIVTLFWVSLLGLLHTYVVFPLLMRLLLILKPGAKASDNNIPTRPVVSILVAAHNEEKVIAEKLESVMQSDYPADKLEIFVGSDCSDDGTDSLVKKLSEKYHQISLIRFESRTGKPGIINQLVKQCSGELLIITDANVMFEMNTISALVQRFENEKVCLVDSNMVNVAAVRK